MSRWCVVLDDPLALRGHMMHVPAFDPASACAIAEVCANHADQVWLRSSSDRSNSSEYAIAFPLNDAFELDHDSDQWPLDHKGKRREFAGPAQGLISFRPALGDRDLDGTAS